MPPCNKLLGEHLALNSRWYNRRWMLVRLRLWHHCARRLMRSTALTVRARDMTTRLVTNCWMWSTRGMPCGPKAAFATKGYFAGLSHRRGRQLGRVLATLSEEVVVDQLFAGNVQLRAALQPLVEAAETALQLDESKRARTSIRVDAGAGTVDDLNWLLARGYARDRQSVFGQTDSAPGWTGQRVDSGPSLARAFFRLGE